MRKHIKPAHPDATIPDPERKGDLPPEGRVAEWSVHWAKLAAREDIIVTDVAEGGAVEAKEEGPAVEPEPEPPVPEPVSYLPAAAEPTSPIAALAEPPPEPPPADGTVASVPFMITNANRKRLRALGKSDDEIATMKPEEAQALLNADAAPSA